MDANAQLDEASTDANEGQLHEKGRTWTLYLKSLVLSVNSDLDVKFQ